MPHFPPALLRDIADQTSIVELVGRYVQLKRKGSEWWGCCPFHQEKSASFKVNEVRKAFKCFGCGEGGDAYSFLMRLEGMSFVEAVKELADRAGVTIPEEDLSPREQEELAHKDALYHANELACRYFQEVLQSEAGEAGRAELDRRGVTAEIREQYRLGVSPDAWDGLAVALKQAGISAQVAEEAGLVLPRRSGDGYYDRFRNRLMFPIRARNGKVVAFGGRTLGDDDAKYLNSSESPVYRKSSALYGLHQARSAIHKDDLVLVVEGYFDVLSLSRAGLGFSVAPCGTALTESQLSTLRRQTRNVVMLFDSDTAGRRAAMRALELSLAQGLWPCWLSVPDGKDPDDFVREHGGDAMRALLAERRPLLDVYIEELFTNSGKDSFARDETLSRIAPLLRNLSPTPRRDYMMKVAGLAGVDPRTVEDRIRSAPAPRPPAPPAPGPARAPSSEEAAAPAPVVPSTEPERLLLRLLVQDLGEVANTLERMGALAWIRSPCVSTTVGRLLAAWRDKREPTAMELLPGLNDPQVLHALSEVLASESSWIPEENLEKAIQECLVRLRIDWSERQRARLARELHGLQQGQGGPNAGLLTEIAQQMVDLDRERTTLQLHLQELL